MPEIKNLISWETFCKNAQINRMPSKELAFIERAFYFARNAHENQKRLSGEPYVLHPINIAENVASSNLDAKTIAAALLHDTIEDSKVSLKKIRKEFGDEVAFLVNGVTKVNAIKYKGIERTVESIKKMFLAVAEDIRVVILKLYDRLHNMETLYVHPKSKQYRIALETLEIYSSIANRLGMGDLKAKLEDLAFPYIYPKEYKWLKNQLQEKMNEREEYLKKIAPIIIKELKKENIRPIYVLYRAKHLYSIWQKLLRNNMDFSSITDLAAIRIIVKNIENCYAALGIVHKLWKPLPGRIKDYIALPKPNGYQSLHTTVFCKDSKITEFQIRTLDMDKEAEYGIAAHWAWEEAGKPKLGFQVQRKKFFWVRQLQEWQKDFYKNSVSTEDFLESLKIDFFKDRIFALTPKGDVIDLPEGSTPVDFAYNIHSDLGDQISGAKVNGKLTSLSHQISSGDIVEIITQRNKKPKAEWLSFVKSQIAKNRIRAHAKKSNLMPQNIKLIQPQKIKFTLKVEDRVGLIKDVTSVFSKSRINIHNLAGTTSDSDSPQIHLSFTPKNKKQIELMKIKLKNIKGVYEIEEVKL
jgi:GTP pyrophosphokinase